MAIFFLMVNGLFKNLIIKYLHFDTISQSINYQQIKSLPKVELIT